MVTGASRGVGRATAIALARAGAHIVCAARATDAAPVKLPGTIDETARAVRALGREALAVPTNLAQEGAAEQMIQAAVDHFGRLDILVNNAAITFPGDLDIPLKRHDLIMQVNLRAPFIAIREAVPHMKAAGGGAICNVSSAAAMYPHPGLMSYGISKIGLERLTVDCARQLAPHGIAVNCFRIDIPVASEGFVANTPGVDRSTWEPTEVPAEGIVWMLRQPPSYTGRLESMYQLRMREGIMASKAARPYEGPPPPTELFQGLAPAAPNPFAAEPQPAP